MFLSVVIPTYNRRPILAKCLRALEAQTFAADSPVTRYELVLVDDGSTDDTLPWLAAHQAEFPHVRLVQQDHKGIAAARNLGVTSAQGDCLHRQRCDRTAHLFGQPRPIAPGPGGGGAGKMLYLRPVDQHLRL